MKKYEYYTETSKGAVRDYRLNEIGETGFELVSVAYTPGYMFFDFLYVFRREKEKKKKK